MIELLLNGKEFQVKIDTGADITAITEEYSGNWMGLRETGKSLHGPAKQPTNNAWTIQFIGMLTYQQSNTCQEIFAVHNKLRQAP